MPTTPGRAHQFTSHGSPKAAIVVVSKPEWDGSCPACHRRQHGYRLSPSTTARPPG